MNIIFGESITQIPDSYTVLELDTLRLAPDNVAVTAYCVIEKIPLQEFPLLDAHKILHNDIMVNYRGQHWEYCEKAITALLGKWNGEVDTFYQELLGRISRYKEAPPAADWDGTYVKSKQ